MKHTGYDMKRVVSGEKIEEGQFVYETGETAYAPRFRWMPRFMKHVPGLRVKLPVVRAASPTDPYRVIGAADGKGNAIVMPPRILNQDDDATEGYNERLKAHRDEFEAEMKEINQRRSEESVRYRAALEEQYRAAKAKKDAGK